MTKEELAGFDGREGRSAYVAVNGKIYDVTMSPYWTGGRHLDTHQAGADLSADLLKAPHIRAVIERFSVVAELTEMPPEEVRSGGGKVGVIIILLVVGVLAWFLLR